MKIKVLAFLLLITLAFSTSSYADPKEGKVEWSQVPPKVQQTITKYAEGGQILKIKTEKLNIIKDNEKIRKTAIYIAKIKKSNTNKFWISVDKNGQLIDIEKEQSGKILEDMDLETDN